MTIRTVDVVVLTVAMFRKIKPEMWIALGSGTNLRYIGVHQIANKLGPRTCDALSLFHALTVCDIVSAFGLKTLIFSCQ